MPMVLPTYKLRFGTQVPVLVQSFTLFVGKIALMANV